MILSILVNYIFTIGFMRFFFVNIYIRNPARPLHSITRELSPFRLVYSLLIFSYLRVWSKKIFWIFNKLWGLVSIKQYCWRYFMPYIMWKNQIALHLNEITRAHVQVSTLAWLNNWFLDLDANVRRTNLQLSLKLLIFLTKFTNSIHIHSRSVNSDLIDSSFIQNVRTSADVSRFDTSFVWRLFCPVFHTWSSTSTVVTYIFRYI